MSALAANAAAHEDARAGLARAFENASAAAAASANDGADAPEARRRLNREREGRAADARAGAAHVGSNERRLEHLRRDLEDTAAACRGDAAACGRSLGQNGHDLSDSQRRAGGADARRRLESAVSQLRERLRRGALDGAKKLGSAERAFARAARGGGKTDANGTSGVRARAERAANATGEDVELATGDGPGDEGSDADEANDERVGGGASGEPEAASGAGIGREAGGPPLGARAATPEARGHEREARVRDGAGPTRAQVIDAAARRGFATGDYVRVYDDYAPVAEEAIAGADVPDGRRYVVRRYFQLIRPRARTP